MIVIRISFFIAILFLGQNVFSQASEEAVKDSIWRLEQSYLDGVYIPANEEETFEEVKALAPASALEKFANVDESRIAEELHFGLGGWFMQNWQLEAGSRLSYYLYDKGLRHPDDMVDYLIVSLHRHLNDVPQNAAERIEKRRLARIEKYKKKRAERLKNAEVIDTFSRPVERK